jgi:SlyX protein
MAAKTLPKAPPHGRSDRLTELEIQLAHATRLVEDLNDVVARQSLSIDRLERRVVLLMQRAAEQEADGLSGTLATDQKPPHW